jgi:hypothetical protein
MPRSISCLALLLLAPLAAACGSDDPVDNPNTPTPIAVTESFSGTLNPNGGRTYQFTVQQAGTVSARLTALAPDDTVVVGLMLGTWNGVSCSATIPNDNATLNTSVVGTAQQTGQFCTRVYDAAGTLTANTDFTVEVTHF